MILWATVPLRKPNKGGKWILKTDTKPICAYVLFGRPTYPILARNELVGPGGERGRSGSSNIGGGMAAFAPLDEGASSS